MRLDKKNAVRGVVHLTELAEPGQDAKLPTSLPQGNPYPNPNPYPSPNPNPNPNPCPDQVGQPGGAQQGIGHVAQLERPLVVDERHLV